MSEHARVVVIGSGPAGLTAAIYAGRAALSPIVVEGLGAGGPPGGQLTLTSEVENFPGFPRGILGQELIGGMRAQAERFGAGFVIGDVTRVDLARRPFTIEGAGIDPFTLTCDALIVATGSRPRKLGLEAEERLWGNGVSSCAVCDGALFKGEDVVVVGGGDTAMEEATYLARLARSVTVVHRRDELRASKIMAARARGEPKISWELPAEVVDIIGDSGNGVQSVVIRDLRDGRTKDLPARAFFLAIGYLPNTALYAGQLALDEGGWIVAGAPTEGGGGSRRRDGAATATSVPGVFAAGDCADRFYRQAVTAAGSGCQAAIDAERWLAHHAHGS
jgi:thioredoxin reductase (NADPH)